MIYYVIYRRQKRPFIFVANNYNINNKIILGVEVTYLETRVCEYQRSGDRRGEYNIFSTVIL